MSDYLKSHFEKCNWESVVSVCECIKDVLTSKIQFLFNESEFNVKDIAAMSAALLEDICISYYARDLWNEALENINLDDWREEDQEVVNHFISMAAGIDMEYDAIVKENHPIDKGLQVYTTYYGAKKPEKIIEYFSKDMEYLKNTINRQFFWSIYPVFWIAMLNTRNWGVKYLNDVLVEPIRNESMQEQYVFSLLINERTTHIAGNSINSGIRRSLVGDKMGNEKKTSELYERLCACDVTKESDRLEFVVLLKRIYENEDKVTKSNKKVMENNFFTLLDLLNFNYKKINKSLFLYMLNRMTKWIDVYFYSQIYKEGGYFFAESIALNWYFLNLPDFSKSVFWGFFRKRLITLVNDIRQYVLKNIAFSSRKVEYQCYEQIYDELFVYKSFKDVTRMDVLRFYEEWLG